ncbi:MAG: cysteine hydrolase family protein [Candidatus Dormibacteria bacterium]
MADFVVVPNRTALINVDLQNCFVKSAPDGLTVLARINQVASSCRGAGILVIHTAHVLRPDGSNMGVLREMVPKVRAGMLNKGAESAALHTQLNIDAADLLIEKPRFGAFHGTDLELILRSRGIDTVIISGISTPVCCDTTAREANARDFRVLFLSNATASGGSDAAEAARFHNATLENLDGLFAQVLSTDELLTKIDQAGPLVAS